MSALPNPPQPGADRPARPKATGFAVPGRFHVFLLFMTQFIFVLALFGGVVPTLHGRGVNTMLLIAGSAIVTVAVFWGLSLLGRLLPVRCRRCGAQARFRGLGWWPFIYRYACHGCGQEMRHEITGG